MAYLPICKPSGLRAAVNWGVSPPPTPAAVGTAQSAKFFNEINVHSVKSGKSASLWINKLALDSERHWPTAPTAPPG
jgi:hypothetical protein